MASVVKRMVKGVFRAAGFDIVRVPPATAGNGTQAMVGAHAVEDRAILERVRTFTMTSDARILAVIDAVRYLARFRVPGAIVECGVWKGGSMMAAALALKACGDEGRELWLYDTFEGMSEPTPRDKSFDGVPASDQLAAEARGTGIWCAAGLAEVKANLATTGYPGDRIRYVQGKVEDTIPGAMPEAIALLRLDTDWYESTRHELKHLYPRLAEGGVLIIDDYGHWQGARQATGEHFAADGTPILLNRIDYPGRIALKPGR